MPKNKIRTKGYSLWLIPAGEVYQKLAKTISQLSRQYSAPNFEPHITLLGQLARPEEEVLSKTSQLATLLRPLEIKLTRVDYLDQYFRCLFIRVEETKEVVKANLKAREVFSRQNDPQYTPHLSLMYGHFTPKIKEKIIAEIGREFNLSFKVRNIYLFSTKGEPKDWCQAKKFPLKFGQCLI